MAGVWCMLLILSSSVRCSKIRSRATLNFSSSTPLDGSSHRQATISTMPFDRRPRNPGQVLEDDMSWLNLVDTGLEGAPAGVTSPAVVTTTPVSDKTWTSTTERIQVSSNAPDSRPPLLHQAVLRDAAVETDASDTRNQSIDGPPLPVVVSLLNYEDDGGATKGQVIRAGYPVVCVLPCEIHRPNLKHGYTPCGRAPDDDDDTVFGVSYWWQVSDRGVHPPLFETVTQATPFTAARRRVLDSIYFSRGSMLRCIAHVRSRRSPTAGNGFRLASEPVVVSDTEGVCAEDGGGNDFSASMEYLNGTHRPHPNQLHITVHIPHRDSMLPLVSTHPVPSAEQLFTNVLSQKQHVCSNFLSPKSASFIEATFLNHDATDQGSDQVVASTTHLPERNTAMREGAAVTLYEHLDTSRCLWTFTAILSVGDIVDVCGGSLRDDYEESSNHRRYLTVQLPLYVTLVFPTAGTLGPDHGRSWMSVERRSQLELTFAYSGAHWTPGGLRARGAPRGSVSVKRLSLGRDGRLSIYLISRARFHGSFVLKHPALRGAQSQFLGPTSAVSYLISLVWSEQTFNSPAQLWKASSTHSFKDYQGAHTLELVPCLASADQDYAYPPEDVCNPLDPIRFQVSISVAQTSPPVPTVYSLDTEFQLLSDRDHFLADPRDLSYSVGDADERHVFFKGETLFGRVLWNPLESLSSGLRIDQVYLCAGRRGFTPSFDPAGTELGRGPSFGCVQPSHDLEHRFLLLDRHNHDEVQGSVGGVSFQAKLADEDAATKRLKSFPGVDGFSMVVDPLYEAASGTEWYLQVLYSIIPLKHERAKRSQGVLRAPSHANESATNMHVFIIGKSSSDHRPADDAPRPWTTVTLVSGFVLLATAGTLAVAYRYRKSLHRTRAASSSATVGTCCECASRIRGVRVTQITWTFGAPSSVDTTEV